MNPGCGSPQGGVQPRPRLSFQPPNQHYPPLTHDPSCFSGTSFPAAFKLHPVAAHPLGPVQSPVRSRQHLFRRGAQGASGRSSHTDGHRYAGRRPTRPGAGARPYGTRARCGNSPARDKGARDLHHAWSPRGQSFRTAVTAKSNPNPRNHWSLLDISLSCLPEHGSWETQSPAFPGP